MRFLTSTLIAIVMFTTRANAGGFVEYNPPALVLPTAAERAACVARFKADAAVRLSFKALLDEASVAANTPPKPLREIIYEGRVSNDPARLRSNEHLRDMSGLRALVWSYLLTGNAAHADAAVRYLTAWVDAYVPTGNDVNENKLDATILAFHVLRDRLPEDVHRRTVAWLKAIGEKQIDALAGANGNRLAKRVKLAAAIGQVTDDPAMTARARAGFDVFLKRTIRVNGATIDFEHRDSLSYHQASVKNGIEIVLALAEGDAGYTRRVDGSGSLRDAVAFLLPYARGEKTHAEWVHTKVDLDRRRAATGDPAYQPGRHWQPEQGLPLLRVAALFDDACPPVIATIEPIDGPDSDPVLGLLRAVRAAP